MSFDLDPDEPGNKSAVVRSPKIYRSVLDVANLPKYWLTPVFRLVRVGVGRPFVGELPQVGVQLGEQSAGRLDARVGPPPHDRD